MGTEGGWGEERYSKKQEGGGENNGAWVRADWRLHHDEEGGVKVGEGGRGGEGRGGDMVLHESV